MFVKLSWESKASHYVLTFVATKTTVSQDYKKKNENPFVNADNKRVVLHFLRVRTAWTLGSLGFQDHPVFVHCAFGFVSVVNYLPHFWSCILCCSHDNSRHQQRTTTNYSCTGNKQLQHTNGDTSKQQKAAAAAAAESNDDKRTTTPANNNKRTTWTTTTNADDGDDDNSVGCLL